MRTPIIRFELTLWILHLVLRMLSNHVGEDLFLKGVSTYLKQNLYKNSVTKDLWDGISATTGRSILRS